MWRELVNCGRLRLLASAGDFTGKSEKMLGLGKENRYRATALACKQRPRAGARAVTSAGLESAAPLSRIEGG